MREVIAGFCCFSLVLMALRTLFPKTRMALSRAWLPSNRMLLVMAIPLIAYASTKRPLLAILRFEPPLTDGGSEFTQSNVLVRVHYPAEAALERLFIDKSEDAGTNWTPVVESIVKDGPWNIEISQSNTWIYVYSTWSPPPPEVTNETILIGGVFRSIGSNTNVLVAPSIPIIGEK